MPVDYSQPPRDLGDVGFDLWSSIIVNFQPRDSMDAEMLYQACAAAERAEMLHAQIERDGLVVAANSGPRDHPLLKHELANRAFATRTISRLITGAENADNVPGFVKRREKFWGKSATPAAIAKARNGKRAKS